MRQNYQELLAAGIRYFGTWRTAIEAAGIPYDSVRKYRDWSKERIIETIQRLEKDGVDLSFRSMMLSASTPRWSMPSIRPNHFGSWKDALTAAGLAPEEIYRYRSWDDESIISEIRRLNDEGADLSSKKMDETANPLIATARRRFGNWGAAVERAGIDYSAIRRRRRWTSELVLQRNPPASQAAGSRPAQRRNPPSASGALRRSLQSPLLRKLDQGAASRRRTRAGHSLRLLVSIERHGSSRGHAFLFGGSDSRPDPFCCL